MLATPLTSATIPLDDLTRWIRNAPAASLEKGMLRLARAANKAARGQSARGSLERRRRQRSLVFQPLLATPIDDAAHGDSPVPIVTRFVSEGGLDFYSSEPLPYRRVAVELPTDDASLKLELVTELRWCRFSKEGIYINGGVFCNAEFRTVSEVA